MRAAIVTAALAVMGALGLGSYRLIAVPATWYVDDITCPAAGSGSLVDPFCRIQDAICAATAGDTVSVAPGSYPESIRMKPGVSLISQAGPAQTTIDGLGQPCTNSDFCTKDPLVSQCSVVIFALDHTPDTVLEGFTITGGEGRLETDQITGGGVLVFSSPTIRNNIITNNVLAGPAPAVEHLAGAGVYVALGRPVITGNSITNNLAVPPDGTVATTSAYGGGLWMGIESAATVTGNVIQGNVAGDINHLDSVNTGGGLVVFGAADANTPVVIDGNLIADNTSKDFGGGIAVEGFPLSIAEVQITNNVVVGNISGRGGGIYTYRSSTSTVNNTVVDNTAVWFGGGQFTGSQNDFPITISNSIIQNNQIQTFPGGDGAGIHSENVDPNDNLSITFNDIFGAFPRQCAGDISDADCDGVNGNISVDAMFADEPARDFNLVIGAPTIDMADPVLAPPADGAGVSRGIDGDGTVDSPQPGDVDMGAFESIAFCQTLPEVCDGLDNNCSFTIDEGFPDNDLDGIADCVDPDDDNDGIADTADCLPFDPTAFGQPSEVLNVSLSGAGPTSVSFDLQDIGSSTEYEILSGLVTRLTTAGLQETFCVADAITASPWVDTRPAPPLGEAWFYEVRSLNNCGLGTFGSVDRDAPGAGDACPLGVVDLDFDGSPSDMDCDDLDAARSPLLIEVCDGLDNDCNLLVDDGLGQTTCGIGECQVTVQNCEGGVEQTCTPGTPAAELCDGLDNDCDGVIDNGFPDFDLDGISDCIDPDDDNDGVLDGDDCAPLDASAFGVPTEVDGLDVLTGVPTQITWTEQVLGTGTQYDLVAGDLLSAGSVNFAAGICLSTTSSSPATDSRPDPAVGGTFYYLVKAKNACDPGTFGSVDRDTHPACP